MGHPETPGGPFLCPYSPFSTVLAMRLLHRFIINTLEELELKGHLYTALFVGVVYLVFLLFFVPWAFIWAVNTLFLTAIPFTFRTWLAVIVVSEVLTYTAPERK
jgi:hypothetical protein